MRESYTFEEVEKILTSTNPHVLADELGRTYVAIVSIRNKYAQWVKRKKDPHNNTILPFFKKFKESGKESSVIARGRKKGFIFKKNPLVTIVSTEDDKEISERKINTKELLASIMKRHEKELQEVVYQMAQQMVLDLMQEQYKQTEKIVTTMTQRRLKKIL
jgi:hypothetical protein